MKLYTESDVIKLTTAAFNAGLNHNAFIFSAESNNITPIELPSDEEIENKSKHWGLASDFFFKGAKYVIDHIKKQK